MKGFTLIELLTIVALLGILSAIALPNIGDLMDRQNNETHLKYNNCAEYIKVGGCYYKMVELDIVMP